MKLKANRRTEECRMSNVEGWNRFAQSFFYKNGQNTLLRCSILDVRPARNALMAVWVEFSHLIYILMLTPIKCTMHGRRVFDVHQFSGYKPLSPSHLLTFPPSAFFFLLTPEHW